MNQPDSNYAIIVENLSKWFGSHRGVEDLNFSVNRGEIFGFIGPNGAGKTTTIRMFLNLLKPDSGQISIFGNKVAAVPEKIKIQCGYLPGSFAAYSMMRAEEYLNYISYYRDMNTSSINSLIKRLQISDKDIKKKIKDLSHGTIQKIGIVQALFHKPQLIILDEPTNGLDPLIKEEFYTILNEFRQKGHTIFLSSHNLSEVQTICKRVAIIREGNLVVTDSIKSLQEKSKRYIKIRFKEDMGELNLPGTTLIKKSGFCYEFQIDDDLNRVLKRTSKLSFVDITIPEPDLESIFKTYYQRTNET